MNKGAGPGSARKRSAGPVGAPRGEDSSEREHRTHVKPIRTTIRAAVLAAVLLGPPGASAQEAAGDYRMDTEDAVQIQVWQRPDLSGTFVVDQQGSINLPLLGAVTATGRTATELARELERRLVVIDPSIDQVLVTVVGFNSRRFKVVGEVRVPGVYTFRKTPTLWDLILTAGGATAVADMADVQIVREVDDTGRTETLSVDLSEGIENTSAESIPPLKPGDSVVVPSLSAVGVSGDQIQVLGSVRNPGLYPLRVAGTVVEAISVSGGHLGNADLTSVRLARRTRDGALVYTLDIDDYLKLGYPDADLDLQAGDTVTIPSRSGGAGGVFRTVLQVSGLLSAVAGIIIATDRLN